MSDSKTLFDRNIGSGVRVKVWEKSKDDGSVVRWVQLSRFDQANRSWVNLSMFADAFDMLGLVHPEVNHFLKNGV